MIRRVVGLVALIAGILLIVFSIVGGTAHTEGDQIGVDCGSVFSPVHFGGGSTYAEDITNSFNEVGCKPAIKAKAASVWTMIGFGIALTVLGAVAAAIPARKAKPDEEATMEGGTPIASSAPVGVADQLERLAELHASGSLSDEEYAKAKSRALDD